MIQSQATETMLRLLEEYYGVKYRDAVKNDLRDYLNAKHQDVAVALFEFVKLHQPTQYKEPPCVAIFEKIYWEFEADIIHAIENDGQGIKLKSLMEPKRVKIASEEKERIITPEEDAIVIEKLRLLKEKFKT